jgi:serine/threonine-protein kinase
VWLNGELQSSVTPTTLEGLPFGREVELKVSKQGYESFAEKVTLSPEETEKALDIKMVRGSVTVVLRVTPAATVYLDGKRWEGTGDRIEGLSAGEHKLVLSASGHLPQTFTFTVKKGETKTIEATLVKGEPGAAGTGAPGDTQTPDKPKGGSGKVNVAAKGGYCDVSINGRSAGPTPVAGVVVAEGPVSVTCKTPGGKVLSSGGTVKAGETTRISFTIPK